MSSKIGNPGQGDLLFLFDLFDVMKTVDHISDTTGVFFYFSSQKYRCHGLVLKLEYFNLNISYTNIHK